MKVCSDNIVLVDDEKIILGDDQDHEIYWDSTSNDLIGIPLDIDDLRDVQIIAPTEDQVLAYNSSTQKWENQDQSGGGGFGSDATSINGILYLKDDSRNNKFISSAKMFVSFGKRFFAQNQYLNHIGNIASNNAGYRLIRNATITGLSCQLGASGTCTIEIRKNDDSTAETTLTLSSVSGNQDDAVNVDLNQGDYLQCYLSASSFVQNPVVIVEIAWRL